MARYDPGFSTCDKCGQRHVRVEPRSGREMVTCARHRRNGQPCHRWRTEGMHVCEWHGGKGKHLEQFKANRRALTMICDELDRMGGQIDVDPLEAMMTMVREAAWNVAYLRSLVSELRGEADGERPVIIDDEGVAQVHPAWTGAGIASRIDPANWRAAPNVLVQMYNDERDRLMRYSKLCVDAGVEERYVKIAERQGQWLVTTLDRVLEQLMLSEQQQQALPAIMGRIVDELDAGGVR